MSEAEHDYEALRGWEAERHLAEQHAIDLQGLYHVAQIHQLLHDNEAEAAALQDSKETG